ncbi:MAG: aminotransferase class V-fold PLP-dependent enzyme [Candidatus Margulisbacteria bacterium]|jgi:selenocysteine lyase/cysteine desulfurase|nr:aminotransferase class V-fold PLP-dependent enzyme [Candidatus Margulisiibacteriota bacterium]
MHSKNIALVKELVVDLARRTAPAQTGVTITSNRAETLFAAEVPLEQKLDFLRGQLLGNGAEESTVFGRIRQLYADYTAQGKQLALLIEYEKWFSRRFGNTHTAHDLTADFSHTAFKRCIAIIHEALKADEEHYVVLPVGQGTSGALERLHKILGIDVSPATLERLSMDRKEHLLNLQKQVYVLKTLEAKTAAEQKSLDAAVAEIQKEIERYAAEFVADKNRPVVLITGQEHHGNTLPYDGTLADKFIVPFVPGTVDIDLPAFAAKLQELQAQGRKIIVSFSAASNVTGHKTDIIGTATLAKKYGAVTVYDHAAALAYEPIDLSLRTADGQPLIDAVVASPHKLPGGPGSTGLLVFNKAVYSAHLPPTNKAGGTVWHVSLWDQEYSRDMLERELSGTPNGIGLLRMALAIDLSYNVIGFDNIQKIEQRLAEPLYAYLQSDPSIILYGDQDPEKRVPILSFNVRHGGGLLHPNFVARILSDLFGIQTRPGCSCAGEYGHYLLGIEEDPSRVMQDKVREGIFAGKPGWVRLNPQWLFTAEQVKYIGEAVKLVAQHGYKLLSLYELDEKGGYNFKDIFKPDGYVDVNVLDAQNVGIAQAVGVFGQQQLRDKQNLPREDEYDYGIALLSQLKNAKEFLNRLPDNSAELKTLRVEDGAPLPLLYAGLTGSFQQLLSPEPQRLAPAAAVPTHARGIRRNVPRIDVAGPGWAIELEGEGN